MKLVMLPLYESLCLFFFLFNVHCVLSTILFASARLKASLQYQSSIQPYETFDVLYVLYGDVARGSIVGKLSKIGEKTLWKAC